MTAFIAVSLIWFGLIQWAAAFGEVRGLSVVGSLHRAGVMLGFVTFVGGVYLALAEPPLALALAALPGFIVAAAASVLGGVLTNWTVNPTLALMQPAADADHTALAVAVPIPQLGPDVTMPATWLRPKAAGAGPAVLLVCGAGDTRAAFKWRIVRAFLSRGIAVLTVDPPGHGEFRSVAMTSANAREAGRGALGWLRAQEGVARVGVCGISLGGCQAANLAAEDPGVAATVLMCTPVRLDPVTRAVVAREIAGLFLPRNLALLREGSVLTLWREWQSMRPAWFGRSLYKLIDEFDAPAAVQAMGGRPVLIVHGTRDAAVPPSNARLLHQAAPSGAELLWVRQATHVSAVLYPEEVGRMAEWLARRLG